MSRISHIFGNDLDLSSSGGLAVVSDADATNQAVVRRLCTNPAGYIWQADYGAGLPASIGQPVTGEMLQGVISAQMALEGGVDQSEPITTTVSTTARGDASCTITFTDSATLSQQALTFTS